MRYFRAAKLGTHIRLPDGRGEWMQCYAIRTRVRAMPNA